MVLAAQVAVVDVDQVGQGEASLESDCSVGIIQSLQESCLELRQERLQHGACLGEEDGEGVQHRGLDVVGEPVAQDPYERPGDVDHGGLQGLHAGQLDDLTQPVSGRLLQLWGSVQYGLSEDWQQWSDALQTGQ